MTSLLNDLRFALRRLARAPRFVAITILLLGLAFAANACVFGVVWDALYRPLPFANAEQLVTPSVRFVGERLEAGVSVPIVDTIRQQTTTLQDIAVYYRTELQLGTDGEMQTSAIPAIMIEPGLAHLLGLRPLAGRLLSTQDAPRFEGQDFTWPNGRTAVISERFAQARFGSAQNALDQILHFREGDYRIVGVLPVDIAFARYAQVWVALDFTSDERNPTTGADYFPGYFAVARLKPGVGANDAETELRGLVARQPGISEQLNANLHMRVHPLRYLWTQDRDTALQIMFAAVALMLLLTAINVCNLYLARRSAREHETAILAALGAGPALRLRLILLDVFLLVGGGAALGLALWPAGLKLLAHFDLLVEDTPFALAINTATLVYVAAISFSLMVAMTLAALWSDRRSAHIQDTLKHRGNRQTQGRATQRARRVLLVAQIALTTALLIGTGLMVRSAQRLLDEDVGFDRDHLVVSGLNYPDADPERFRVAIDQLRERIAALPGVAAVALSGHVPFMGLFWIVDYVPPNADDDIARLSADLYDNVGTGYFSALSQRLIAGRDFTPEEVRNRAAVVIVDSNFVRQHFADGNALGRTFRMVPDADHRHARREVSIIGVVEHVKHEKLDESAARSVLYRPGPDGGNLLIRTWNDPATLIPALAAAAHDVAPGAKLGTTFAMRSAIAATIADRTRLNQLLACLSALALILAAVGLYAVLAYSVRLRTAEFGIRLALGAQPNAVLKTVLARGLGLVGIGLATGLPIAYAFARLIASQLYRVDAVDPPTLLAVSALIAAIGLLASWLPARNAARVDPMTALRAQ